MNQNDTSIPCKIEDQESRNNPPIPMTIPWKPEGLSQEYFRDVIPALYNYTLIGQFLSYVDSMSYNPAQISHEMLQNNIPTQIPPFTSKNKNVRRDFDDFISPMKSLKLNTFDGEKVKLEDGFSHAESFKTHSKTPLSEASIQEGCTNSNIPIDALPKKSQKEKSVQNPRKNLPGLVLQRIRATCMNYLGNKSKPLSSCDEGRLKYVKDIFDQVNPEEIRIFQEYFMRMDKNSKTWKSTSDYINGNRVFSQIMHRIIEGFLGEEGTIDFEDWLATGKMTNQTKQVIREGKDWLIQKYKEVIIKDQPILEKKEELF